MRNRALHDRLRAFAEDASERLGALVESGLEIPFEVSESPGRTSTLYHYRPLSDGFVRERFGELRHLDGYGPALKALTALEGLSAYLRALGIKAVPVSDRDRADTALRELTARTFEEVSSFELQEGQFERAYNQLESLVYENAVVATMLAPLTGVRLCAERWELGSGLALVRGDLFTGAPAEAVWSGGAGDDHPNTLIVMTVEQTPKEPPPLQAARLSFRRLVTTLRLFRHGPAALASGGWWRLDDGPWQPLALASAALWRRGDYVLEPEDRGALLELFELVRSRPLTGGRLPWALARFESGCEQPFAIDGLSDHLLAARALLDSEDPSPVGVSTRLAALCAEPAGRGDVERAVALAFALERLAMRGDLDAGSLRSLGAAGPDEIALDLEEQLRAILRDMVCGYLDADVRRIADDLLMAESARRAEPRVEARRPAPLPPRRRGPRVERWAEVVVESEDPPAEAPPEPEFARPSPARAERSAREDREQDSEQDTEETPVLTLDPEPFEGPAQAREITDWGFDDDPADYSAIA